MEKPLNWWQAPDGSVSSGRIGFAVCIVAAVILAGCQVGIFLLGKQGDLTGIIGLFLGAGFGGKVGQSFAERGQ